MAWPGDILRSFSFLPWFKKIRSLSYLLSRSLSYLRGQISLGALLFFIGFIALICPGSVIAFMALISAGSALAVDNADGETCLAKRHWPRPRH